MTVPTSRARAASPRARSLLRRALRHVERSLAFAGLALIVYHAGFGLSEVVSPSMSPTLCGTAAGAADNDWILWERITDGPPPRGHLVVFQSEDGVLIAKRVVAFPGERVKIDGGRCFVNDVPLELPPGAAGVRYLPAGTMRPTPEGPLEVVVPDDAVWVLGDHSADSWDSRYFGGLARDRWRGRVVGIVWPPRRWRWTW